MTEELTPAQRADVKAAAREAVREELAVTDPDGQRVTLGGLLGAGLTRRQALVILGSVAGGAVIGAAIEETVDNVFGGSSAVPKGGSASPATLAMGGYVVPMASGLGASDAVDPGQTRTPVQDGVDAVARAGGGTVLLPPEQLNEAETLVVHDQTSIRGHWGNSTITFPPGTDGILIDAEQSPHSSGKYLTHLSLDGVTLAGPGHDDTRSGVAIRDRGLWLSRFGTVQFENWNGVTWLVEEGAGSFDNRFDYVYITECDAGEASRRGDGLITWNSYGSTNRFGYIAAYPTDAQSHARSRILSTRGMAAVVGALNVGNAAGVAIEGYYNELHVDTIHWEPTNVSEPVEYVVKLQEANPFSLRALTLNAAAEAQYAYAVETGGHAQIPIPRVVDDAALTRKPLRLDNKPVGPILYYGPSDDVTTRGNWNTGLCSCLADFATVG